MKGEFMIVNMNIKKINPVPGNATLHVAELESEGKLWGVKIHIDVIGVAMLQMIQRGSSFVSPTVHHMVGDILNILGYQVGRIVVDEPVPGMENTYRATVYIHYGGVEIHKVKVRGSDALIMACLYSLPLWFDTALCYKLPQDPGALKDFIDNAKPEEFNENNGNK